ncbi:MAG: superoxide dismutase, Ni [Parcubacteria group bacterium]|nr:superoxide dismutase, Ni [Parcubacteria group bacterium]
MNFFKKILPTIVAEAHCDIPCGIYDPTPAKIAAKTVQRMVMQIKELEDKDDLHGIMRRIAVKEQHAELCKKELQILWSDFFKPEHLQKHPDLHEKFWNALKLCSKNKQSVDEEAARALVAAVDEIAKIFYEVKNAPERFDAYKKITDKLF